MFLCLSLRFHCSHRGPLQSAAEAQLAAVHARAAKEAAAAASEITQRDNEIEALGKRLAGTESETTANARRIAELQQLLLEQQQRQQHHHQQQQQHHHQHQHQQQGAGLPASSEVTPEKASRQRPAAMMAALRTSLDGLSSMDEIDRLLSESPISLPPNSPGGLLHRPSPPGTPEGVAGGGGGGGDGREGDEQQFAAALGQQNEVLRAVVREMRQEMQQLQSEAAAAACHPAPPP
eukprot:SAG22_NODE_3585_length_1630_cov_2.011104_1_plen_234_part_10